VGLGLIIFQFAKFKNLKIVKFLKLKIQISQALAIRGKLYNKLKYEKLKKKVFFQIFQY
jgi:hypothetical protein